MTFIDPTSGATIKEADFPPATSGQANLNCGPDPGSASVREPHGDVLSAFNVDFTKLAVSIPGADGASDVGYETTDGQVTDVTAEQGQTGDFQDAPDDESPTFQPGTNNLWFAHSGKAVSVVAGGDETSLVPHPTVAVDSFEGGTSLAVDASGKHYLPSFVPVSSDGTKWLGVLENDDGVSALPCASSGKCNSSGMGYGVYPAGGINGENDDIAKPLALYPFPVGYDGVCDAWAWISDSSWLCNDSGSIAVVTAGSDQVLTVRSPIPQTSGRVNFDPVISPDGTQIAFQSCRAGDCAIFTVPVDGSSEPTKVAASPGSSDALVAWRSGSGS